jgi:hypothetical protein
MIELKHGESSELIQFVVELSRLQRATDDCSEQQQMIFTYGVKATATRSSPLIPPLTRSTKMSNVLVN